MMYKLYDLEISTNGNTRSFNCSHVVGQGLIIEGENFRFKSNTKYFSHYVLSSLIPYLAAKQRANDKCDWMYFENEISCPDPKCGAKFAIKRRARNQYIYKPRGNN